MKKARILTLDTQVVSLYLFICIYFMAQGKREYRYKKKARHYMVNDAEQQGEVHEPRGSNAGTMQPPSLKKNVAP